MTTARLFGFELAKRLFDIYFSALMLIVSLPIFLVVGLLVRLKLGKPIIFAQQRPGRGGRIFTLYKFRSMRAVDPSRGLESDDQRLTAFGRVLRSTSLDELPTLLNVFVGDMSFVGPRPLLVEYLPRYTPEQARRHEVRPGITGLAQVNGRNALSWEAKFRFDIAYVDSRSLALDTQILLRTVRAVFLREGISHEGHSTMTTFGSPDD